MGAYDEMVALMRKIHEAELAGEHEIEDLDNDEQFQAALELNWRALADAERDAVDKIAISMNSTIGHRRISKR